MGPNIKELWWWKSQRVQVIDLSGSLISGWGGEINSSLCPEDNQHLPHGQHQISVSIGQKNSDTNKVKKRVAHVPEEREEWSWWGSGHTLPPPPQGEEVRWVKCRWQFPFPFTYWERLVKLATSRGEGRFKSTLSLSSKWDCIVNKWM